MMRRLTLAVGATVALVAAAGSSAAGGAHSAFAARFGSNSAKVTNSWFPLRAGTTFVYRGVKDGKNSRDVVRVTRATRVIAGVRCVVIDDRNYLNHKLGEKTTDWYAQDRAGNVWYVGETTETLSPSGKVTSREGTWLTGRHGAQAGIFMPANPHVGDSGRQEYYRGHAEDRFRVLSTTARVHTPAASSRHALLTKETTRLEPAVVDHKVYVRGVGTVRENEVRGGVERATLVSVRHG